MENKMLYFQIYSYVLICTSYESHTFFQVNYINNSEGKGKGNKRKRKKENKNY